MSKTTNKFAPEVRERAVRMVLDHERQDPIRLSTRTQRDEVLKPDVARVFAENFAAYGVRKVWRQMMREAFPVARCTVERLMRDMGLQGLVRGKPVRATGDAMPHSASPVLGRSGLRRDARVQMPSVRRA